MWGNVPQLQRWILALQARDGASRADAEGGHQRRGEAQADLVVTRCAGACLVRLSTQVEPRLRL